jgi:tRNA 2-thiouridine synthesizing protein A
MSKTVNARGLPCPQPVILTRNALPEGEPITTIVDNDAARQNVACMAEKAGAAVQVEQKDDGIYLHISGVKLTVEGSPMLDNLCALRERGVGKVISL